ncbi:hypothetical protein ES703_72592 [subsurface metagenome]
MTQQKPRKLKVLEELSKFTEPVGAAEIAGIINESTRDVGKVLYDSGKGGLAQKPDEKKSLWLITDKGKKYIENPPVLPAGPSGRPSTEPSAQSSAEELPEETVETVPSQSDLFRSIGERLGIGTKKGDIRLDAIIYYVQRTANLDNLTSVWNALTEMGVASDVKKRWIKLYAQTIPGKEIPEELKEKLETGLETEKVRAETGEIPPKPKRFSVVGDQIVGDPEGDLNFKEALQLLAQMKGVPSAQADPLAAMVEAMKLGPDMATATLTTMIPLITKEGKEQPTLVQTIQALRDAGIVGKEEGGILQTVQVLKELGMVGKTGEGELPLLDQMTKLGELGLLRKPGEEETATSDTIRALEAQIKQLTDALQRQEMESIKGAIGTLSEQLKDLRTQISTQGKLEGRFAILDKVLDKGDSQLSGVREDIKTLVQMGPGGGGSGSKVRTPGDQTRLVKGLKDALAKETRAHELEEKLLFGGKKPKS